MSTDNIQHDNPTIIWEKWKDPLGYDENDNEQTNFVEQESDDEFPIVNKVKKIKCNIISTPFGMIPVNENTASTEIFNFWTGHSNFAITKKIADLIESTDGVETLNVFTKYRFRIAVGKAFNDSQVMRNINNNIYDFLEHKNVQY